MKKAVNPKILIKEGKSDLITPSAIVINNDIPVLKALREEEIYAFIEQYA
jgi:hypothetical protein